MIIQSFERMYFQIKGKLRHTKHTRSHIVAADGWWLTAISSHTKYIVAIRMYPVRMPNSWIHTHTVRRLFAIMQWIGIEIPIRMRTNKMANDLLKIIRGFTLFRSHSSDVWLLFCTHTHAHTHREPNSQMCFYSVPRCSIFSLFSAFFFSSSLVPFIIIIFRNLFQWDLLVSVVSSVFYIAASVRAWTKMLKLMAIRMPAFGADCRHTHTHTHILSPRRLIYASYRWNWNNIKSTSTLNGVRTSAQKRRWKIFWAQSVRCNTD